ncbi:MAG: hypothetical protein ACRDQC_01295, partial [Gaiellales bacterium]
MKRLAITPLLAGVAIAVAPGVAHAAVIAAWPLATGANDTSGNGHNGAVQNVVFDGSGAAFNGSNTRITVPYSTALSPGAADVTTSLEINTTHQPGTGNLDFDLIRAEPGGKMYKVELFPHGKIKAQAQCIYTGSLAKT